MHIFIHTYICRLALIFLRSLNSILKYYLIQHKTITPRVTELHTMYVHILIPIFIIFQSIQILFK